MTTRTLAVVSAGLSQPSSTRLLADRLAVAVSEHLRTAGDDVLVEVVELRPLARDLADHFVTGFPPSGLEAALSAVTKADALVVVTPVFTASYSGLFKSFFDVLQDGSLRGKPTIIAATAGTARHSLVLEHALRPLFAYLRALVVPTGVFAATEDFGDTSQNRLDERVERAADELAALVTGSAPAAPPPDNDVLDVMPFEDLLRGDG
jgi:FMN reductase